MIGWSDAELAAFVAAQRRARETRREERARFSAEVREEARAFALHLAREYGATRVLLFGSVVRGEAGPGSDVDLAVVGIAPARFFDAAADAIAHVRHASVDLAPLDALHPHIRARAEAEGEVLLG